MILKLTFTLLEFGCRYSLDWRIAFSTLRSISTFNNRFPGYAYMTSFIIPYNMYWGTFRRVSRVSNVGGIDIVFPSLWVYIARPRLAILLTMLYPLLSKQHCLCFQLLAFLCCSLSKNVVAFTKLSPTQLSPSASQSVSQSVHANTPCTGALVKLRETTGPPLVFVDDARVEAALHPPAWRFSGCGNRKREKRKDQLREESGWWGMLL